MYRVFIDGQAGTTGLQIHERLTARDDIELLEIAPEDRKSPSAKQAIIDEADVVMLCLPDEAAIDTVSLNSNSHVRFIDASTAHRTHPDWAYGFAELTEGQREKIASSRSVSNPGCYPTGFLAAVRPLTDAKLLKPDALISISAVSGYSGGGRQMIEQYEARSAMHPDNLWYVRPYALPMKHKHIPEMKHYAGLEHEPAFMPSVGHFQKGMLVSVPVFKEQLSGNAGPESIHELLSARYDNEPCINVMPLDADNRLEVGYLDQGFLDPQRANGTNRIDLFVFGHADQILLVARLDNLGKGASGAAVQNMNLMLQLPELEGLNV